MSVPSFKGGEVFCYPGAKLIPSFFSLSLNQDWHNNDSCCGLEPQWELNPRCYCFRAAVHFKSCFAQQSCYWHRSSLKLWWASEQFCDHLLLLCGILTSAHFHRSMQGWFEWLHGCDQDLSLRAESKFGMLRLLFIGVHHNFYSTFLALWRQEETLGIDGEGWEVAGTGQRSSMQEISSGDHKLSQCGLGSPKERLADVRPNVGNFRQSWIETGAKMKKCFASLNSSFGSFADPGVLTNISPSVSSMDDYAYTLLVP